MHGSMAELTFALQRGDSTAPVQRSAGMQAGGSQAELTSALRSCEGLDNSQADITASTSAAASTGGMATRISTLLTGNTDSAVSVASASAPSGSMASRVAATLAAGSRPSPSAPPSDLPTITEGAGIASDGEATAQHAPTISTAGASMAETAVPTSTVHVIVGQEVQDVRPEARNGSRSAPATLPAQAPNTVAPSTAIAHSQPFGSSQTDAAGYDADFASTAILQQEDSDLFAVSPDIDSLFTAMRESTRGSPATLSTLRNRGSVTDSSSLSRPLLHTSSGATSRMEAAAAAAGAEVQHDAASASLEQAHEAILPPVPEAGSTAEQSADTSQGPAAPVPANAAGQVSTHSAQAALEESTAALIAAAGGDTVPPLPYFGPEDKASSVEPPNKLAQQSTSSLAEARFDSTRF